ncbi:unnamed protein product [Euphydryas editha]|uniref:Uncharacterized protein n=1 Tax=Euphydryas editha TaxID=104508 RepID=A0AAU9UQU7_EUPED|nr:unnamed protein product [Euphydryas editha]
MWFDRSLRWGRHINEMREKTLQLAAGRLLEAETALCTVAALSTLSTLSAVNGLQRHYLALSSPSSRWSARRRHALGAHARANAAGECAARRARALRVLRRAAAAAAPALARCAALPAALLHAALVDTQRADDAQIKIDNRMKYILGLRSSSDVPLDHAQAPKIEHFTPKQTNLESMLDSMFKKTQVSPSLPCIAIPPFQAPDFLEHARTCTCYACDIPECTIIACLICYLEASIYYRAKEFDIAKNYFSGASKVFCFAENKLNNIFDCYKKKFNNTVVDISKEISKNSLNDVQLEFLIEQGYFELSRNEFEKADDTVIRIHEILSEIRHIDKYLQNEITNLMIASANLRKTTKQKEVGLENDFENLKLSPVMPTEQQKTPETKNIIPKTDTVIIVNDEEIPKKRKVIKLNFEEPIEEENVDKTKTKPKPQFKIPIPVTSKPTLEKMTPRTSRSRPETTPRSTRSRPDIVIQQASIDEPVTPKSEETGMNEFFTPFQSTPAEQFFTPMTSIKTYSRKVVKNLESEFSTPAKDSSEIKTRRSKVETGSIKAIKDKRTLKRATSPGKLVEEKPARPRRLRQPILTDK